MTVSNGTEADSARAQEIWADYLSQHDLSNENGKTAGVDPVSGRVWLGDSIQDIVAQRDAESIDAPLYFTRVGSSTYYRKGGRR